MSDPSPRTFASSRPITESASSFDDTQPFWIWLNIYSIDAVLVGTVWQYGLTVEFCGRPPSFFEAVIIASAIWVAYTADRLLDASRLDCSKPHAIRHRIHRDHRAVLTSIWAIVLSSAAILTFVYANESQLRWGLSAIAVVIVYVVSVQLRSFQHGWIPKELVAGFVFAFGVGLPVCADARTTAGMALPLTLIAAGILFAANCIAVAMIESDYDQKQGNRSFPIQYPGLGRWLPLSLLVLATAVMCLTASSIIPAKIGISMVISSVLLAGLTHNATRRRAFAGDQEDRSRVSMADAVLVVPVLLTFFAESIAG